MVRRTTPECTHTSTGGHWLCRLLTGAANTCDDTTDLVSGVVYSIVVDATGDQAEAVTLGQAIAAEMAAVVTRAGLQRLLGDSVLCARMLTLLVCPDPDRHSGLCLGQRLDPEAELLEVGRKL